MRTLMLVPLFLAVVLVLIEPPLAAQDKQPDKSPQAADSITPIASDIKTIEEATVDYAGQTILTKIQYAQQGDTIFVLPVWHIRTISRNGKPLKPDDLLVDPQIPGEPEIDVEVVNLLTNTAAEKAIQSEIIARIKQLAGAAAKPNYQFSATQFRPRMDTFTLIAPGRGKVSEIPLTEELPLPPNKVIAFTLKAEVLNAAFKANRNRPLKLAQLFLRVKGEMKVRLEQTQVLAQVDFIRGALTELQKSVESIKNSSGKSPEVLVELPDGGSVKSLNNIRRLAQQSLSLTISARSGADTGPILSLVQSELNSLLERQKTQITDDNKRLAFVLENQVAITATMGEIKKLAKMDEQQREAAFKTASEDYASSRVGKSMNASATASADFGFKLLSVGGSVSGSYGSSSQEDSEQRTKRELETLNKAASKLMKEFEGKQPTLSGISFDDATVTSALATSTTNFSQSKLTTDYTVHTWPLVSLAGQLTTGPSTEEILRQYAILKADYEVLQKLVGTPTQLAEAKANMEKLAKLNTELQDRLNDTEKALAKFEKSATETLAKVDGATVAKLQKEMARLKRNLGGLEYSNRIEAFQNLEAEERPPGLDCTGPAGADAQTVLAAQKAWAKYLGETSHIIAFPLTKDGKVTVEMCLLPSGKYYRGEGDKQTIITLTQSLWVSRYEVTQKQYAELMGNNPSRFKKEGDGATLYPVETVSHDDCVKFSKKASEATGAEFRLLREAEWEYAYRAGTRTKFYNGDMDDKLGEIAQYSKNNSKNTEKVGSKAANAFGLYDMAGNVWEWCSDWYADYDGKTIDPRGPDTGSDRVDRGGGWYSSAELCRAADRSGRTPSGSSSNLGFRLARVPSGSK